MSALQQVTHRPPQCPLSDRLSRSLTGHPAGHSPSCIFLNRNQEHTTTTQWCAHRARRPHGEACGQFSEGSVIVLFELLSRRSFSLFAGVQATARSSASGVRGQITPSPEPLRERSRRQHAHGKRHRNFELGQENTAHPQPHTPPWPTRRWIPTNNELSLLDVADSRTSANHNRRTRRDRGNPRLVPIRMSIVEPRQSNGGIAEMPCDLDIERRAVADVGERRVSHSKRPRRVVDVPTLDQLRFEHKPRARAIKPTNQKGHDCGYDCRSRDHAQHSTPPLHAESLCADRAEPMKGSHP